MLYIKNLVTILWIKRIERFGITNLSLPEVIFFSIVSLICSHGAVNDKIRDKALGICPTFSVIMIRNRFFTQNTGSTTEKYHPYGVQYIFMG